MTSESPRIEAYVLRFVLDAPDGASEAARLPTYSPEKPANPPTGHWHGVVIRVQTQEEKTFSNFADAVAFIARDIHIGDFVFHQHLHQGPEHETGK